MRSAAVAIVSAAAVALAQGPSDLPQRFTSRNAAAQAGCRFARVKGPSEDTCIVADIQADPMAVSVYERASDGAYILSNAMAIPSWSWGARLSFVDVLGGGSDWLMIDTPGMHGTGISQRVLLVIGWDGTRFRTVVAESLSYGCYRPTATADYHLAVGHTFATTGAERSLEMRYELTRDTQRIGVWRDSLRWNAAQFAFVRLRSTVDQSNTVIDGIRQKIAGVRGYSQKHPLDPVKDSGRWIGDSGLMDVMDPACVQ